MTENQIKTEAMAYSTLGKNHLKEVLYDTKAYNSFIEGAKFGHDGALNTAIEILSQNGSEAIFREYAIDLLKTLRISEQVDL